MNMYEMIREENAEYPGEKEFKAWIKKLEMRLGHEVNPDGLAYNMYEDEFTIEEAFVEYKASAGKDD